MPSYLVVQPNGKLAMFSTIVDDFTYFDMTDDEAVQVVLEEAVERAREHAARGIAAARADGPLLAGWTDVVDGPPDGLRRWRYALSVVRRVHGAKTARKRARAVGE